MSMKEKTELSCIQKFISRFKEVLVKSNREDEQFGYGTRIHSSEEIQEKEIKKAKAKITQTRLQALDPSSF